MPPMSAVDLTDLDFTQMIRARAPASAAPAAPPPAPAPAPAPAAAAPARAAEVAFRGDFEIGRLREGHPGNFISYARAGLPSAPVTADSPIVLVEDDEITRQLLAKALATHGYPVRCAADSRQFQALMRTPPLPRLILLDVELPQVNGFKILAVLRQHPQTSTIPLLMLTARTESKDLLQALSLGADGYLSKPVTVATLRSTVDRLLRRKG
jgi:CheY-like chemotaxis protein